MTDTADEDARHAWSMAVSLDDAPPERVAAVVAILTRTLDGDIARITAAAEFCRAQAMTGGDLSDVDDRAAELLDAAADLAANPPPKVDDDGDHLDTGPAPRPAGIAARWRRLQARRVRYTLSDVREFRRIGLRLGGGEIGKVMYQVCQDCQYGLLGKISINQQWQRAGVGRRAIRHVVTAHPGLVWHTTIQMSGSEHFWAQMATETGSPFAFSTGCQHMRPSREDAEPAWDRLA